MLKNLTRQTALAALLAGIATAAPPIAPREANQERESAPPRPTTPVVEQRTVVPQQQQQPAVSVDARNNAASGARNETRELDEHVATCLMLGNQEEINLSRFGHEKATDPRVKEFAQRMIQDHEALAQKLKPFAGHRHQASSDQPTSGTIQTGQAQPATPLRSPGDRREARQELRQQGETPREAREVVRDAVQAGANAIATQNAPRVEVTAGFRGESAGLHDRMYQIARDTKRNCEEMTKEELSKKSGAEFDEAFLGCQIGAHIAMLAELKAAQPHVSPEFQQVLTEATQATKEHKAHAHELMKDLSANTQKTR